MNTSLPAIIRLHSRRCFFPLILLAGSSTILPLQAAIRWQGDVSENWNTAGNWDLNRVPNTTEEIIFPATAVLKQMFNNRPAGTTFGKLTFEDSGFSVTGNAITLGVGGIDMSNAAIVGTTTIGIDLTLADDQSFITNPAGTSDLVLSGAIQTAKHDLTFTGNGNFTINDNITETLSSGAHSSLFFEGSGLKVTNNGVAVGVFGNGSLTGGELRINGTFTAGIFSAATGTTLGGRGTFAYATANATVRPGSEANRGLLTINSLTFNSVSTGKITLRLGAVTTPGTTYDQVRSNTVNLNDGPDLNLSFDRGFTPVAGQIYTLLDNTGSDAINGTFASLPEGSQVTTGIGRVRISYVGGTGNDVTATVVSVTNTAPSMSAIADVAINQDTATGVIPFTVGDNQTGSASVIVTAASSNAALVPVANIVLSGTAANRTVQVTPSAGNGGSATITLTASDGILSTTRSFDVVVNAEPVISAISDKVVNEDTPTPAILFTISDAETPTGSLTITKTSSNTTLVPTANIVFGVNGTKLTVTVSPALNQSGNATITLTVSDGSLSSSSRFLLTVNAVNDAPTISSITDKVINEDTSTSAIPFTIGDVDTPIASLTVTKASSNPTLVPVANIVLGGTGASRSVTITPAPNQNGSATIDLLVNDGALTTTRSFLLTVNPVNDPPVISAIGNQLSVNAAPVGPLQFTVSDDETPVASLTVTAASSAPSVVPVANIVLGGSGADRTVTITPLTLGSATITLSTTDGGGLTGTQQFLLTVQPPAPLPTDGPTPLIQVIAPGVGSLRGTSTCQIVREGKPEVGYFDAVHARTFFVRNMQDNGSGAWTASHEGRSGGFPFLVPLENGGAMYSSRTAAEDYCIETSNDAAGETIFTLANNIVGPSSLAIMPDGKPALVFSTDSGQGINLRNLNFGKSNSSTIPDFPQLIVGGTIESGTGIGSFCSLAASGGFPVVAYSANGDLKFARASINANNAAWTISTVDTGGTALVGDYCSLASVLGKPAISYYDATNQSLKYARNSAVDGSGEWTITVVDAGTVGGFTSLAVVGEKPAIAYYDLFSSSLKFARNTAVDGSGGWQIFTLDSLGDVGRHASLVNLHNRPAISYFDSDNNNVKWATTVESFSTEIAVEQPANADVPDGGGRSFGSVAVGSSASLTFTIRSTGSENLTGLVPVIDGPDASQFFITSAPVSPVIPGNFTTCTVRFSPTSSGPKSAGITFPTNDFDERLFNVALSGIGGPLTFVNWTVGNGLTGNNSLSDSDPDGDGIKNLLEYGFNLNPKVANPGFVAVTLNSATGRLEARFTRVPDATDLTYEIQVGNALSGWTTIARSVGGATMQNLGAGSVTDPGGSLPQVIVQDVVTVAPKRFMRIKIIAQ